MQITKLLCDKHYDKGKDVSDGVTTVPFSLGKRQHEGDLCPACVAELTALMEPFFKVGRRIGKAQAFPAPPKSPTVVSNDGPHKCTVKDCDRGFTTGQGLSMHMRRTHGDLKGSPAALSKKVKVPA
jgi:hypothetical protein